MLLKLEKCLSNYSNITNIIQTLIGFFASILVLVCTLRHNSRQLIGKENKELLVQTIDLVEEIKSKIAEAEQECDYIEQNPYIVDQKDCQFYRYFRLLKCQIDKLLKNLKMQNLNFEYLSELHKIILKYSESKNLNCYDIFEKKKEFDEKYGEYEAIPSEDELQMKNFFWTDYKKYKENEEGQRNPAEFFTEFNELLEKIGQSSLEKIQELNRI